MWFYGSKKIKNEGEAPASFTIRFVLFIALMAIFTMPGAPSADAADIEVVDLKIATSVVEREPVGADSSFSSDVVRLYCCSKVRVNVDSTSIFHAWYYNGNEMFRIELPVKRSPGFRTYSNKRIMEHQKGEWEVRILDAGGETIESIEFTVK